MKEIEDIYGISVNDSSLFKRALTHPSYTKENNIPYYENYERLEFLGDAVLKLLTSKILYEKFPEYTEGELSKIRSIIVSDNTLSKISKEIGLCDLIILSHHEAKQGYAQIESVSACAFEAVLGAFFLDGKLKKLIPFLKKVFTPYIEEVDSNFVKYNAKAILQEYTQSIDKHTPVYSVIDSKGPAHKKIFTVSVAFQNKVIAQGSGKTKKDAEQHAAYEACKIMGVIK